MSQQKKSTTPKATVALVNLGCATIEGLYCKEKDQFYVAVSQVCGLFRFDKNQASRDLKALLGEGFGFDKVRTTGFLSTTKSNSGNKKAVNVLQLKDFEVVLRQLDRKGNEAARNLVDLMVGLSLNQLFCNAFGIKCEEEQQMAHLKARMAGMTIRRMLTAVIKAWYERNPGATTCPYRWMFSKVTNQIYQALWQKDALDIEAIAGCGRNKLRDHLSPASLKHLESAEERVMDFIELDNIKPSDAVELAEIRKRVLKFKEN